MFRTSMVAACCGLAASALVFVAPATGAGDEPTTRVVLSDGTGDVWRVNVRTSGWTLVGDLPAADVTRAVVSHRRHAVVVRSRYDDLRRIGKQTYWTGITTPRGDLFSEVVAEPGSRSGQQTFYAGAAGAELDCRSMSHDIDYAADVVLVRISRRCLDNPRWVRVNTGNILMRSQKPRREFYADNPHNADPYANFGTRRLFRG